MKSHELKVTAPTNKKRLGRGIGSGTGKTAGRGTKGQNSRTGGGVRPGFEGGQNPLSQRLPKKRGFKAYASTTYAIVNVGDLDLFKEGGTVDLEALLKAKLIKSAGLVKLLAGGELAKKLTIKVDAASNQAVLKVEQAGGKVELTSGRG